MIEKRCGLGFSCASTQQQVEIRVEDCPNFQICGAAQRLEPDVEFELICAGSSGVAPISTTRRRAAVMLLLHRGCPQSLESFGLEAKITALTTGLSQLTEEVAQHEGHYIAPADVEAVAYSVKRPRGMIQTSEGVVQRIDVYWYNKLMSPTAIFAPAERARPVKVIHLSKNDDPRNLAGRRGVERRNQLNQIATQLQIAERAISKARDIATAQSSTDE